MRVQATLRKRKEMMFIPMVLPIMKKSGIILALPRGRPLFPYLPLALGPLRFVVRVAAEVRAEAEVLLVQESLRFNRPKKAFLLRPYLRTR